LFSNPHTLGFEEFIRLNNVLKNSKFENKVNAEELPEKRETVINLAFVNSIADFEKKTNKKEYYLGVNLSFISDRSIASSKISASAFWIDEKLPLYILKEAIRISNKIVIKLDIPYQKTVTK